MRSIILLLAAAVCITSCSSETYHCKCKDANGTEVAAYELKTGDKKTAEFECGQKNIKFANDASFKGVTCTVE